MKKVIGKFFLILLGLVLMVLALAYIDFEHRTSPVNSIAHRGYSAEAPENTLAAYRLAKEKGFSYVECDISFTKDGTPVLLHDSSIDRTSNGQGELSDLTYDEIKGFDFGGWFSSDYAGEKIPKFSEFIDLCVELELHPYLELKSNGDYTEDQIAKLVELVEYKGLKGKVTWISFEYSYLAYIKVVDPSARLGYVTKGIDENIIENTKNLMTGTNEVFIDAQVNKFGYKELKLAEEAGVAVEVWTVNYIFLMRKLSSYISGVTSDKLIAEDIMNMQTEE